MRTITTSIALLLTLATAPAQADPFLANAITGALDRLSTSAAPCSDKEIADVLNQHGKLPVSMSWIAYGMERRICFERLEYAAKHTAPTRPNASCATPTDPAP